MIKIGTIIMNKYNVKDYIKVIGFQGKIKGTFKDIKLRVMLPDNSVCCISYEIIKHMEGIAMKGGTKNVD